MRYAHFIGELLLALYVRFWARQHDSSVLRTKGLPGKYTKYISVLIIYFDTKWSQVLNWSLFHIS